MCVSVCGCELGVDCIDVVVVRVGTFVFVVVVVFFFKQKTAYEI